MRPTTHRIPGGAEHHASHSRTDRGAPTRTDRRAPTAAALAVLLLAASALAQEPADDAFTASFRLGECRFGTTGRNPYFPLAPGRQLVFENEEGTQMLFVTVLGQTRRIVLPIDGKPTSVRTRVVEEREFEDGELIEVSRNFFAVCEKTNDVFYFGEDVDIYEDGEIVSHDGAWLAGRDGALPGILMPGRFLLGSRYFQEVAPGVALDRAEHVAMGLEIETPAGTFSDCVEVRETSPLDAGAQSTKQYCAGVGLVRDNDVELVGRMRRDDDDSDRSKAGRDR